MTAPAAPPVVHDRTIIDWITVTHDEPEPLLWFLRGPTEVLGHGYSGYKHVIQDGYGTKYCSEGSEPRPFMLIMSGQARAAWRAVDDEKGLVHQLAFDGVHCTRLDLARTTTGPWTPYWLRALLEQDRFVSTWRNIRYTSGKGGEALTVQMGSRQSSALLRVYDKKAEMAAKGEACPFDRLSRWELEIKGDLAPIAFRQLAEWTGGHDGNAGESLLPLARMHAAWLGHRLTLTEQPVDRANKNQSRAVPDPDWLAFLDAIEGTNLCAGLDERGPRALARDLGIWATRSLAPTIATLADLGGPEAIQALIEFGRLRRSAKHAMLLEHVDDARSGLWTGIGA